MDRFRELATFVAVADEGGFAAAARRLDASPPAVTRLVAALEARLGIRLLNRTTRQVALTEAGARLRADAARILADLAEAEAAAAGAHAAPQGLLRVTAPVEFGQRFVAPILRDFLDAHPAVSASALFVDRVVDLIDEGFDVAVRIAELPDSALTARRVGTVRRVTVAAPGYIARHGAPGGPDDLSGHRVIHPRALHPAPEWPFATGDGVTLARVDPALDVNTMAAAIAAAEAGWGITRALSYQVADALAAGRLAEVLAGHDTLRIPIQLTHSEGRRAAAKIRAFVDFAAGRLRAEAARLAAG